MSKKKPPEEVKKSREISNKNLRTFDTLSPEERSEVARKGNLAQQNVKKKRRALREIIEALGTAPATEDEKEIISRMFPGIETEEMTKDMLLIASMYRQAIKGNVKAASFVRDTVGEKPDTNITGSITTEKIFITQEEKEVALQHIREVISDGNEGN